MESSAVGPEPSPGRDRHGVSRSDGPDAPVHVSLDRNRRPSPWKNGGGTTWEVARSPTDGDIADFDWRVSTALIERDGPFSTFPGIDRLIVAVGERGFDLTVDGVEHQVDRLRPFDFSGDRPTSCRLTGGPARDVNVMTRRGVFTATIEVLSLDGEPSATIPSAHESLVFVVTGRFTVGGAGVSTIDLGPLDAAIVKGYARIVVNGTGTALLIRLHPIAEIPARGLPGASGTTHPFTRDASIDANGALKSD